MAYRPIENYGVIGNMRTVALVGQDGSIDWFCFPHFDSPSIFGAILDDVKGGHFKIAPTDKDATYKQFYWPDTNVLVSRFHLGNAVGEIIDFMPPDTPDDEDEPDRLIRYVKSVRGRVQFRVECHPAFNYARDPHRIELTDAGAHFITPDLVVSLCTNLPLKREGDTATVEFTLEEGQTAVLMLHQVQPGDTDESPLSEAQAEALFTETVAYWRRWLSQCTYTGRWREMVYRSALVLKLLTYEPTGAIVASPTCSLPENIGGERNWDYRYTWIRDAAFTLYGLLRIGFTEEAGQFIAWLQARMHELKPDGSLQVMYRIDGSHDLTEELLDNLEGYRRSSPVRIGNGAHSQLQLDIYGELMDSIYLYNKYGTPISYDLWVEIRRMIEWVCKHWQQQDRGIWEIRGEPQQFVYSKLMCWVALDRGVRLADKRSFPADHVRWMKIRDAIYEEIMEQGWSTERESFVQYYGSSSLDASNLLMPLVFFVSPTDPRMLKTLDAINQSPEKGGLVSDSLVFRYDSEQKVDGIDGIEGTFNMCTFWLVEALTRAGKVDEARLRFERMLGYANHLGLFAEETGPRGEGLGNFPQAFTHLALISAAFNLDRALGKQA